MPFSFGFTLRRSFAGKKRTRWILGQVLLGPYQFSWPAHAILVDVAVELTCSQRGRGGAAVCGLQKRGFSHIGGVIVVLITLGLGFIPFVVLSMMTNSFWPQSSVAVPLTLVPSVLLGTASCFQSSTACFTYSSETHFGSRSVAR